MARRYSFLVIFLALLTPLAWWSGRLEPSNASVQIGALAADSPFEPSAQPRGERPAEAAQRGELIETLDRLVAYEHYYRSVYGHYTKLVSRLGTSVPADLSEVFDVRVTEASRERLVISAFSEVDGRTQDLVSIDQDYTVHASFALPAPRPEYLKALAFKQLRLLRDLPESPGGPVESTTLALEETGVFHGFFRYEVRRDSQGRKVAFAVGARQPVLGIQLELGVGDQEIASEGPEGLSGNPAASVIGQKPGSTAMSTLEEAYLAQRIFRGEVGRYAKNWSELSKIAAFRFEDKAKFGHEGQVPFGDAGSLQEIDGAEPEQTSRKSIRVPSSESQPLEIEAINPGEVE